MTVLLYLNSVSASEIGEILGIYVQTIYDWLDVVAEPDLDTLCSNPTFLRDVRVVVQDCYLAVAIVNIHSDVLHRLVVV